MPKLPRVVKQFEGFKHHLRHCRRSIEAKSPKAVHRLIANPTLSIRSSSAVFVSNTSVLSDENRSYSNGDLSQTVDSDNDNTEDDNGFRPLCRKTIAFRSCSMTFSSNTRPRPVCCSTMRLLSSLVAIYRHPVLTHSTSSNQ